MEVLHLYFSIIINHCSNFSPSISTNKIITSFKFPLLIKIVDTGPLPLSILDSITTPLA